MAFKQYTHCTPTADFDPLNQPLATAMGLGGLVAMIAAIFAQALIPGLGIYFVLFGSVSLLAAIINTFEYLIFLLNEGRKIFILKPFVDI